MTEPPAPLVASDVDLRDFAFMPLDVRRLRDSRLAAEVSGESFRAAVLLWCASWHQKPAASLPDDDSELAQLAGFGRVVKEWRKVRDGALHGWVKCGDGRLYHRVVAEKANEAWKHKCAQRDRTEKARIARLSQREKPSVTDGTTVSDIKHKTTVTASKGQGQGQGQGESGVRSESGDGAATTPDFKIVGEKTCEIAGIDTARVAVEFSHVIGWLAAKFDPERDIYPTVRKMAARRGFTPNGKVLAYFTDAICEAHEHRIAAERSGSTVRNGRADDGAL